MDKKMVDRKRNKDDKRERRRGKTRENKTCFAHGASPNVNVDFKAGTHCYRVHRAFL